MNNKFLLFAGLLLGLALAEGTLRWSGFYPRQDRYQVYDFDKTLGWKPKPNSRGVKSNRDVRAETFWDAEGFVVSKKDLHRKVDPFKPSVAWIGDSFVEGRYCDYAEHFVSRYHQKHPELQDLNLGVGGYTPDQMLIRSRQLLKGKKVEKLFFFLFAHNDLPFLDETYYYHQGFPKPKMDGNFEKVLNAPLKRPPVPEKDWLKTLASKSSLFNLIRHAFKEEREEPAIGYDEHKWVRLFQLLDILKSEVNPKTFYLHYLPYMKEAQNEELLRRNLADFYRHCHQAGFNCSDFTQSWKKGEDVSKLYLPYDQHLSSLGLSRLFDVIIKL